MSIFPTNNDILILKGSISGFSQKFIPPQENITEININNTTSQEWLDLKNAYIIITKYKENRPNPYYNIQILFIKNENSNVLEVGNGILLNNNVFRFNLTEESALLGTITFNRENKTYFVNRFVNSGLLFIDSGKFKRIKQTRFYNETGIKFVK